MAQPKYFKDLLIEQCEIAGIMGTIILSSEGVNGSIVGTDTDFPLYSSFSKKPSV